MNPPTIGHEKLLDAIAKAAGSNPYKIYLSQSQDADKNPLAYKDKVKIARKMFPRHARNILVDKGAKNLLEVASKLYEDGFRTIVGVVGSDRLLEFDTRIKKYNGVKGRHGFYNFQKITIISAGERDPDADGAEGMSASKMRTAASDGDFALFSQGLPKAVKNADAKKIYNDVRKGMGLKEETQFKNKIKLEPVSDIRESYMDGSLFNTGDEVVVKESGLVAKIKHLGANYVIIETNGESYRKWLTDVEKIDEGAEDPDIGDQDGKQPKQYYKGLKKTTKKNRSSHFNKNKDKDDDDPSAYKSAPGDSKVDTKPSKHTLKFKQMYGESSDTALKNKAEKSGMPIDILKQVYNRGLAAYKTGHRPGATQGQWAMARVNSFITKSSGTWGKADADLAAKVRGK